MAVPTKTRWPIDEHTKAKHAILKRYLEAWFPILLQSGHRRVVYVDGFCGPGRYTGGEPGSPLIALGVAKGFAGRLSGDLVFLFTDERPDRIEHLKSELAGLELPGNFHIDPQVGRFDEVFVPRLEELERSGGRLAPAFVFIDPFGFSGAPFSLVERILRHQHCEIFVTFMVNALQRFVDHPYEGIRHEIEGLFGTENVQQALVGAGDRGDALRLLYQQQLESRARFVRSFEVRDTPGHVMYHLFFASNEPRGHLKMKEAMWKADPTGTFRFADSTDAAQLVLLDEDPSDRLVKLLSEQFSQESALSDEVLQYVQDKTAFIDSHSRAALRKMESSGALHADGTKVSGDKRRRGTFPLGTRIRFA